jgi:outer membrane immunogenic protein
MKRTLALAAGIASAAAATAAMAADYPRPGYYAPPPPPRIFTWVGPYLGLNTGYQWGDVTNNANQPSGIFGGIQAGYNWQIGQFVFGGETDIQLSAADDTFAPYKFSNPWFGTLRARGGVAFSNVLLFGTAGLAYGNLRAETAGLTESHTNIGWTVGGGIEVGFTPNWSAKAEWLYLDLSDSAYSLTGANHGLQTNLLRFGVNYRF